MLRAIPKMKLGVLVAGLAGAMMLTSASSAMAKLVKSDSISFKAIYNASGSPPAWETSASGKVGSCKLTSDGEFIPGTTKLMVFPCRLIGEASGIGTSAISVHSEWGSEDGFGAFELQTVPRTKSEPPKETYAGTIKCEEEEEEEPGTGVIVRYPCIAKVKLVFNTLKNTVTGSYGIFEESTLP